MFKCWALLKKNNGMISYSDWSAISGVHIRAPKRFLSCQSDNLISVSTYMIMTVAGVNYYYDVLLLY